MLKDFLAREGKLTKEHVIKIIQTANSIMSKNSINVFNFVEKEANLVNIKEPIVMVGDLHGQYHDLVHMLEKAGSPADIK